MGTENLTSRLSSRGASFNVTHPHGNSWGVKPASMRALPLRSDRPNLPGFDEAYRKVLMGTIVPEVHNVAVRELVTRDQGIDPDRLAQLKRWDVRPHRIRVVTLADGRYWAFEDEEAVHLWQAKDPNLLAEVAVIPIGRQR